MGSVNVSGANGIANMISRSQQQAKAIAVRSNADQKEAQQRGQKAIRAVMASSVTTGTAGVLDIKA